MSEQCDRCGVSMWGVPRIEGRPLLCVECTHETGSCEELGCSCRGDSKQYPTDPAGELDAGAARETRAKPCTKRTWCVLNEEHDGSCAEYPRRREPRKG